MIYQFEHVLSSIPEELCKGLARHYYFIKHHYALGNFESSELHCAKFCEIVYRVLQWHTSNTKTYLQLGKQIRDFRSSVMSFEQLSDHPDSIRYHIPDALRLIYCIRNKRGVAHVAGDIDHNRSDAMCLKSSVDWITAELVRLFNNVGIEEAELLIESLTAKQLPQIWKIGDHRRIISPPGKKLQHKDKVLVLLYSTYPKSVSVKDLLNWTEYKNPTLFKKNILDKLHNADLLHYDKSTNEVILSPLGIKDVEDRIPLEF